MYFFFSTYFNRATSLEYLNNSSKSKYSSFFSSSWIMTPASRNNKWWSRIRPDHVLMRYIKTKKMIQCSRKWRSRCPHGHLVPVSTPSSRRTDGSGRTGPKSQHSCEFQCSVRASNTFKNMKTYNTRAETRPPQSSGPSELSQNFEWLWMLLFINNIRGE